VLEKGLEVYLDELYEAKASSPGLLQSSEICNSSSNSKTACYIIDIDLTKMNNLAKVEEEQHKKQILILCRATKAQGK
jgi:hypothetical protein